jgi:hypothetical protein
MRIGAGQWLSNVSPEPRRVGNWLYGLHEKMRSNRRCDVSALAGSSKFVHDCAYMCVDNAAIRQIRPSKRSLDGGAADRPGGPAGSPCLALPRADLAGHCKRS